MSVCFETCIWKIINIKTYKSGVEALVSWLLDHPDVHVTELSDTDTVSDEYSDEEVLEELEETEPTFPVVHYFIFYLCYKPIDNSASLILLMMCDSLQPEM